jgi:hypothetical protein
LKGLNSNDFRFQSTVCFVLDVSRYTVLLMYKFQYAYGANAAPVLLKSTKEPNKDAQ